MSQPPVTLGNTERVLEAEERSGAELDIPEEEAAIAWHLSRAGPSGA